MGRYQTRDVDERGELILVPEIPDPVMTSGESMICNFCVFHESRETGEITPAHVYGRCASTAPGGCREGGRKDRIFIYRHELQEYKSRALVAKINRGVQ